MCYFSVRDGGICGFAISIQHSNHDPVRISQWRAMCSRKEGRGEIANPLIGHCLRYGAKHVHNHPPPLPCIVMRSSRDLLPRTVSPIIPLSRAVTPDEVSRVIGFPADVLFTAAFDGNHNVGVSFPHLYESHGSIFAVTAFAGEISMPDVSGGNPREYKQCAKAFAALQMPPKAKDPAVFIYFP